MGPPKNEKKKVVCQVRVPRKGVLVQSRKGSCWAVHVKGWSHLPAPRIAAENLGGEKYRHKEIKRFRNKKTPFEPVTNALRRNPRCPRPQMVGPGNRFPQCPSANEAPWTEKVWRWGRGQIRKGVYGLPAQEKRVLV